MSIEIKIYDNLKELSLVWEYFEQKGNTPVGLEYQSLIEWWDTFGKYDNTKFGFNKKLKIIVGYRNQKSIFVLPLMQVIRYKKKIARIITLEFLSQPLGGPVMDIIHSNLTPIEVKQVFLKIKKSIKYHYINLSYIPKYSILVETFPEEVMWHTAFLKIPINNSYENIRKQSYSKNLRHILNKFIKRITQFDFEITSKVLIGKSEILPYKDKIINVSLSKLLSNNMQSVYQEKIVGDYFFNRLINKPNVICSIYELEEELLAYNLGFIQDNVVYAIDAAYNRDFGDSQKIGLGILAYDQIVKRFAGEYSELSMGSGIDDYKFRFTKKSDLTYILLLKGNKFLSNFWYWYNNKKLSNNEKKIKDVFIKNQTLIK